MTLRCLILFGLFTFGWCADPTPTWPSAWFSNFTETNRAHKGLGYWALDLNYKGGAQAIYRTDGTYTNCGSFHRGTPCIETCANKNRYLIFPSLNDCCICCSYADGCGPISPKWVSNAKYMGTATIDGGKCNKWSIQGFETNYLAQLPNSDVLCELDNTPEDKMIFERNTWTTKVDPRYFDVPSTCTRKCGAKGECKG